MYWDIECGSLKIKKVALLLQVWQLGSPNPNFTLEGHEKGVNCVDYYSGGDKPYIISGADDHIVKIWDYQVRRHLFYKLHCKYKLDDHYKVYYLGREILILWNVCLSEQDLCSDPSGTCSKYFCRGIPS